MERRLPHWSQPGTISFITFRAWDSMPAPVIEEWTKQRADWLRQRGIDPATTAWRDQFKLLSLELREEFHRNFSQRWHDELDNCHGACVLKNAKVSQVVADSLRHFDEDRYELTDFVVMPNHVHLLAAFSTEESLLAQCESWKHYTATKINAELRRKGRFWQQDGFDHLVRSKEQFTYLRDYIAQNPVKAKLKPGEFNHYSKRQSA